MPPASPSRRDDPWLRFVRGLVALLVPALERRIARLIHKYEYAPDGSCDFAALDRKISRLEDLRDAYVAWLADPEAVAVLRAGGAPFTRRRRGVETGTRRAVARLEGAVARARGGRCTTGLPSPDDSPGPVGRGEVVARTGGARKDGTGADGGGRGSPVEGPLLGMERRT